MMYFLTYFNRMKGEELKRLLILNDVNIGELAVKLGISRQNIDSRFKAKSVKTDFVEKIESVIGKKLEKPAIMDGESLETQEMTRMIRMMNEELKETLKDFNKPFREMMELKQLNKQLNKQLLSLMEEEANLATEQTNVI